MQTRLGRKFVDETELLPLLLAYGLIRRVRTIQIDIRPLGGDFFKVTLDASTSTVGEAKAEIARSQGTAESCQELYRVAKRADGKAVREDDAEPEPLEDLNTILEDGDVVAMVVKVSGSN
jgi:molybdopterin converting factor small subunit